MLHVNTKDNENGRRRRDRPLGLSNRKGTNLKVCPYSVVFGGDFRMKKIVLLIICTTIILGLNGCAVLNAIDQRSTLSSATEMIKKGKDDAAIVLLEEICSKKGVKDITDEAMFKLGLLYLDHKPVGDGLTKAINIIERLHKEYPESEWTIQTVPLFKFLKEARAARHKIDELEEINSSLSRENKKLNLDIEKIKTLDLELEEKQSP